MRWQRQAVLFYHAVFNAKIAALSAIFNASLSFCINLPHGPVECLEAGLAQGLSSFLSTGFTARVVQHFSPIRSRFVSYFFGSLIPALLTLLMSFVAHSLNKTPEILASCVAPTLISYTTSFVTNYITRRGFLRPGNYPTEGV